MNVSAPDETDMTLEDLKVRLGHAEPAEIIDRMDECAVATCRRPGTVCVDRPPKGAPSDWIPRWLLCETCFLCVRGFGPYRVQAVWEGEKLVGFVAIPPPPVQDDRGPILEA